MTEVVIQKSKILGISRTPDPTVMHEYRFLCCQYALKFPRAIYVARQIYKK